MLQILDFSVRRRILHHKAVGLDLDAVGKFQFVPSSKTFLKMQKMIDMLILWQQRYTDHDRYTPCLLYRKCGSFLSHCWSESWRGMANTGTRLEFLNWFGNWWPPSGFHVRFASNKKYIKNSQIHVLPNITAEIKCPTKVRG